MCISERNDTSERVQSRRSAMCISEQNDASERVQSRRSDSTKRRVRSMAYESGDCVETLASRDDEGDRLCIEYVWRTEGRKARKRDMLTVRRRWGTEPGLL